MPKASVLVVDDEADLIELVRYNLEQAGYAVLGAADGESGFSKAMSEKPDLIVADLMLPGMDGFELCRMLRAENATRSIPIIILTAKVAEADRVVGLELGADDYMTKPFSPRELVARIKALLRRSSTYNTRGGMLHFGSLSVDLASHEVRCGKRKIDLTATEYRILEFLASHPGFVFSRSSLIEGAMVKDEAVLDRTIDVHIMSLRRKLGRCGTRIETIRGFGYKFREANPQG